MCIHTYIHIHAHYVCMCICIYIYIYIYVYIYIYKYIHIINSLGRTSLSRPARSPLARAPGSPTGVGKGQMGSALIGSLQFSCFLREGLFGHSSTYSYLPGSARAYLLPQPVQIHDFCSGPISVDPMVSATKLGAPPPLRPSQTLLLD